MLPRRPLRLVNEKTFHEVRDDSDSERPLAWLCYFKLITFAIASPRIVHHYSVNKTAIDEVTGTSRRQVSVTARVPQESLRDRIFFMREQEKNSGLFLPERAKDDIWLALTEGAPTDGRSPFAAGAFPGVAFRADVEPGEDYLSIEVAVPGEFLREIVANLERNSSLTLHAGIALESFSYEVDDFFRQSSQPRDLLLHGNEVPAALVSLQTVPILPDPEETPDPGPHREAEVCAMPASAPFPEPPAGLLLTRALTGIRMALWAIAVLLALNLVK